MKLYHQAGGCYAAQFPIDQKWVHIETGYPDDDSHDVQIYISGQACLLFPKSIQWIFIDPKTLSNKRK